eukprot:jgi/Mesen1/9421/ME000614S08664
MWSRSSMRSRRSPPRSSPPTVESRACGGERACLEADRAAVAVAAEAHGATREEQQVALQREADELQARLGEATQELQALSKQASKEEERAQLAHATWLDLAGELAKGQEKWEAAEGEGVLHNTQVAQAAQPTTKKDAPAVANEATVMHVSPLGHPASEANVVLVDDLPASGRPRAVRVANRMLLRYKRSGHPTATRGASSSSKGHVGRIRALVFAPDGATLWTTSSNSTMRCWLHGKCKGVLSTANNG